MEIMYSFEKFKNFLLTLLISGSSLSFGQISPGGVSSDLRLWLKANAGTSCTVDSCIASTWNYQDTLGSTTSSGTPTYQSNANQLHNYNPTVQFLNNDKMAFVQDRIQYFTSMSFVVGKPTSSGNNSGIKTIFRSEHGLTVGQDFALVVDEYTDQIGFWERNNSNSFFSSGLTWMPDEIALVSCKLDTNDTPAVYSKNGGIDQSTNTITLSGNDYYEHLGNDYNI